MDWTLYPNFSEAELRCHCGCGRADMKPDFMAILQVIRDEYGKPMHISSGYRCPAHNAAIGGGPEHPTGKAVDLSCANPAAMELVALAVKYGIRRIGVSQNMGKRFIHLGGSHELPVAIWSY